MLTRRLHIGDGPSSLASMRLLLFNLAVDCDHPIWGFTTTWIEALAKRVACVRVITVRVGRSTVPSNVRVYSVGGEKGYSKVRKVATFYQQLEHVLRKDGVDICFSHMIATFSVLAAPLLKVHGVPMVTWHAHPDLNWTLRAAHHVSDCMVTSLSTAYPYRRDKVVVVGQGIDTSLFAPDKQAPDDPPVILCVGRLSPVKEHPILLKAVDLLRQRWPRPFRVIILGGAAQPSDESFIASLYDMVRTMRLEDIVRFEPAIPLGALPDWYRQCTVHVNMTCVGSGDKVALEAMSCGRPSVVANAGFRETLGRYADTLMSRSKDPEDLAERLKTLLALPPAARQQIGVYLREQVVRLHSLDRLADRLVGIFREVLH
ncbi:MAG: glycosyltransferase family 4 protein [Candidatus Methylomirabilaceae bacterium]